MIVAPQELGAVVLEQVASSAKVQIFSYWTFMTGMHRRRKDQLEADNLMKKPLFSETGRAGLTATC